MEMPESRPGKRFVVPPGKIRRVRVELGARSYDIHVGTRPPDAPPLPPPSPGAALLVADENTAPLYAGGWEDWLRRQGIAVTPLVVPAGESVKNAASCATVWERAAEAGLDRRGVIAALGGGVVGDLAGFAAATFLRGVRFVQIPTTLLAMVDSAVGGKTAVNLEAGKNLAGAFHQPSLVLADLATLATLPPTQLRSGMAEVVKYGAILDREFFDRVDADGEKILAGDAERTVEVVARCCELKARVVREDECEAGSRAVLNFGHTLGHSLEKGLGYGVLEHGAAVALGMVYAAELSRRALGCPDGDLRRLKSLLKRLGLPTSRGAAAGLGWETLRRGMAGDKKSLGGRPRFVLLERLGRARFGCELDEDVLRRTWLELEA